MDIIIKMYLPISDISSVQLLSQVRLSETLWTSACQPSLAITISHILLKLMSNHLILCHPPSPSALNFSQGLFHFVIFSHQVAKVLELQLQCGEGNGTPLQYLPGKSHRWRSL